MAVLKHSQNGDSISQSGVVVANVTEYQYLILFIRMVWPGVSHVSDRAEEVGLTGGVLGTSRLSIWLPWSWLPLGLMC